ncbi:MAG: DUF2155 domain-containing protein [Pseudomonadota bacterium]
MRRTLPLVLVLALSGAAGLVRAQQTPAPNASAPAETPPAAPEAEEAPPAPAASPPAPTAIEKPTTSETKPKTAAEKPAEPLRRGRAGAAIIQALDKVTAETLRFEAPVGQPIRYKSLVITVKACETSAADEATPEAAAYLTIDSQPKSLTGRAPPPPKQVFRGWMFASSPGLNPLQHPVYDAWLIACRTSGPAPAKR